MLSLNQSMFRSAPEKHCLGRSHHSCSFSTKCAICSCYMNISNSREKKHQPDNKKHTAKPCILILKTKTSKNLSLPLHGPPPLLTTPVLSFSFPLDLTSGMEAVCLMENPHPVLWMFFQGKPEPSSLDSYHQHQPSVCWSVQSFQVVSTGGNAGGEGRTHQSELYPPFSIQEWALIWAFETHRFIAVSQFSGKFSLVTKLNLSSRLWFDPINIWNKFKQCFSTWI